MASIKIFRNETQVAPITAEPVFWVTPQERRDQLWEVARDQILGDSSIPGVSPAPTGGASNANVQDEIADKISAQDEASTHVRRKSRQRKAEDDQTGDEALKAGAEQKIIRLGVREKMPVDPSSNIAQTMIVAKGVEEPSRRVVSKAGTSGTRHGRSRGLLHLSTASQPPVEAKGNLGPSRTVVMRAQGEHNQGSRVIA